MVEDYERLVAKLIDEFPIDEAMSRAVGGHFEAVGEVEADIKNPDRRGLPVEHWDDALAPTPIMSAAP